MAMAATAQCIGNIPLLLGSKKAMNAHFVQSDSVEFEMALDWRVLERICETARRKLHCQQAEELYVVFQQYVDACNGGHTTSGRHHHQSTAVAGKVLSKAVLAALHTPPPPANEPSRCVWLKNVPPPPLTSEGMIKMVLSQFGNAEKVLLLRDPVTRLYTGHAVVWFEDAQHASAAVQNLQDMMFLLAGTPRPITAEMAVGGMAQGSQSVYDRALHAAFGSYDTAQLFHENTKSNGDGVLSNPTASHIVPELVFVPLETENSHDVAPENCAVAALRKLLRKQLVEQDVLREIYEQECIKLSHAHENQYAIEMDKLQRMEAIQESEIFEMACRLHKVVKQ